jgi:arginine kinase
MEDINESNNNNIDSNKTTEKSSLAEKHLPRDLWKWLTLKTSFNTNIYDCIRSSIENKESPVGLYAPDPEVYDLFQDIFRPVISEYHQIDLNSVNFKHGFNDPERLEPLSNEFNEKIQSTSVSVRRTIKGYAMASKIDIDVIIKT